MLSDSELCYPLQGALGLCHSAAAAPWQISRRMRGDFDGKAIGCQASGDVVTVADAGRYRCPRSRRSLMLSDQTRTSCLRPTVPVSRKT
jgi:hypothetical protein